MTNRSLTITLLVTVCCCGVFFTPLSAAGPDERPSVYVAFCNALDSAFKPTHNSSQRLQAVHSVDKVFRPRTKAAVQRQIEQYRHMEQFVKSWTGLNGVVPCSKQWLFEEDARRYMARFDWKCPALQLLWGSAALKANCASKVAGACASLQDCLESAQRTALLKKPCVTASTAEATIEECFQFGDQSQQQGNLANAEWAFQKVVARDPGQGLYHLAIVLLRQGKRSAASRLYKRHCAKVPKGQTKIRSDCRWVGYWLGIGALPDRPSSVETILRINQMSGPYRMPSQK